MHDKITASQLVESSAINQKGEQPANEIDIFKMAVYSAIERFRFFNDL